MSTLVISYRDATQAPRSVELDIYEQISIDLNSTLSAFPLQSGGTFSDHKIDLPDKFEVQGRVSNTPSLTNPGAAFQGSVRLRPLTYPAGFDPGGLVYPPLSYPPANDRLPRNAVDALRAGVGAIVGANQPQPVRTSPKRPESPPAGALGFYTDNYEDRCQKLLEELAEIKSKAFPCDVICDLRTGSQMQLCQIGVSKATEDGSTAVFSLRFERFAQIDLRLADSPIPAEALASRVTKQGSQSAKDDPKEEAKKESLAHQLLGGGGGAAGRAIRGAIGG